MEPIPSIGMPISMKLYYLYHYYTPSLWWKVFLYTKNIWENPSINTTRGAGQSQGDGTGREKVRRLACQGENTREGSRNEEGKEMEDNEGPWYTLAALHDLRQQDTVVEST